MAALAPGDNGGSLIYRPVDQQIGSLRVPGSIRLSFRPSQYTLAGVKPSGDSVLWSYRLFPLSLFLA